MPRSHSPAQPLGLGRSVLLVLVEALKWIAVRVLPLVVLAVGLNSLPGVDLDVWAFLLEIWRNTVEVFRIAVNTFTS